MYSTDFGELAHKEQIKDGWRRSNKSDAARQIVHSYSRQHAIQMRILNVESLQRRGADLAVDILEHLDSTTSTVTAPVVRRKTLTRRRDDVSNFLDFSNVSGVSLQGICRELIRYSQHNLPTERQLPEDHAILQSLGLNYSRNSKYRLWCSKKPTFTTSTVRNARAPYTSGTKGVAMIGFGSRLVLKRCMVR